MTTWTTVAHGIRHARFEPIDVSITVIHGRERDGLLLVDTRCNPREGGELAGEVAALDLGPVTHVVNTHAHYDHTFGNQVFTGAEIHGHAGIAAHFREFEGPRLEAWTADPSAAPQYDWTDVQLTPPTHPHSSPAEIDVGGRRVELIPLGPGHTDTDVAVHVPDAGVWVLGDVIEQSGPPLYGSGAFPLDWPEVLRGLVDVIGADEVVIPGHGTPVDRAFVERQAAVLQIVADVIREGHSSGEPIEYVAERASTRSGMPLEIVESGVLRGYQQLAELTG